MSKRKTPYQYLLEEFQEYVDGVRYAHRKPMWHYKKADLQAGWRLDELAHRVAAADQLGYEVLLEARDGDLHVVYRKKAPSDPWRFQ